MSSVRLPNEYYQDSQVDSINCCASIIRNSREIHSIQKTSKSQKSLKDSNQKGIRLTYKPPTRKLPPSRLIIKRPQLLKLGQKNSLKLSEGPCLTQKCQLNQNICSKKVPVVQKCISYKNQKILEHNQGQANHHSNHNLQFSCKQQEMYSTRKNTLRTLKNSEDCSQIEKDAHNYINILRIDLSLRASRDEKVNFGNQRKLVISSRQKDGKKTLEKVFEETTGRKIVTLQSQYSSSEFSRDFSFAEPYELPKYDM